MKVLQVVPGMSPMWGGPSVAIVDLTRCLTTRGIETTIITTNADPRGRFEVVLGRPVDQNGATLMSFNVWPLGRYAFSWPLALDLHSRIGRVDVVHVHWLYNFSSLAAAVLARRAGVPYVLQFNGSVDPHLMKTNTLVKRAYLWLAGNYIVKRASALIFTTEAEQRQAVLGPGRPPSYVVPVGLDWADYATLPAKGAFRRHFPEVGDRPMVLFLGRLHAQKGLDLLVGAFQTIAAAHPRARLVIAGPDGQGYGARVRQWVEDRGLSDRVTFAGRLPTELKVAAYHDCDVYVLPSYAENFGATVTEALACRSPVVISDRVNVCDEVKLADAGLVVPCTVEAVADGIRRLLEDPALARRLGDNGRALVQRKFTWDSAVDTLIPIYEAVRRGLSDRAHKSS